VLVTAHSESPTRTSLSSGKFKSIIDEPPALGGTDAGPSPIQVLLMALAGCLNVTGHEVARERGLALNGMDIRIDGVLNPCAFIGCSFEERAGFQTIKVSVDADLDGAGKDEAAAWLEETERRCPVTDNIKAASAVEVVIAPRPR